MTKLIFWTLGAAVAAGGMLVLSTNHSGAAERSGRLGARGQLLERAKEKLDLTDEQVQAIRAAVKADKEKLVGLANRMREARSTLRGAVADTTGTEESVRTASARLAAVEADLAVERHKLHGKISPILTAEQREKIKQFQARVDEFAERMIGRLGEGLGD